MEDEMLRYKYYNLRNDLHNIYNMLDDLDVNYDRLLNCLKSNISINNKLPYEDLFIKNHYSTMMIEKEISERLIPYINNKM